MSELKRTGDPRVSGDGSTFDKPPFVSDFGLSRAAGQAMSDDTQAQAGPEGDGFFAWPKRTRPSSCAGAAAPVSISNCSAKAVLPSSIRRSTKTCGTVVTKPCTITCARMRSKHNGSCAKPVSPPTLPTLDRAALRTRPRPQRQFVFHDETRARPRFAKHHRRPARRRSRHHGRLPLSTLIDILTYRETVAHAHRAA